MIARAFSTCDMVSVRKWPVCEKWARGIAETTAVAKA